ncbi:MAG TPA: transposase [Bryobacteraceae bacterium]|nr:transposase [Bryobacteraceae bacterium]
MSVTAWSRCRLLAGKSTLNRLELAAEEANPDRYKKDPLDATAIDSLLVSIFLEAHREAPKQIVVDLDAADLPAHGHQEQ